MCTILEIWSVEICLDFIDKHYLLDKVNDNDN